MSSTRVGDRLTFARIPCTFAQRRSYDQVKVAVQHSYPVALIVALGGLGAAMVGARLLEKKPASERPGEDAR